MKYITGKGGRKILHWFTPHFMMDVITYPCLKPLMACQKADISSECWSNWWVIIVSWLVQVMVCLKPIKHQLPHWGRVTHICVSRLTITGSDNGLSPGRRQAIIWTNAGILLIGPLGTNFSENLIEILTFSFTKMRLKVLSAKWLPFCLGLNELRGCLNIKTSSYQHRHSHYKDKTVSRLSHPYNGYTHTW